MIDFLSINIAGSHVTELCQIRKDGRNATSSTNRSADHLGVLRTNIVGNIFIISEQIVIKHPIVGETRPVVRAIVVDSDRLREVTIRQSNDILCRVDFACNKRSRISYSKYHKKGTNQQKHETLHHPD